MRGTYLLATALLVCAACGDSGPAGTSTGNPAPTDGGPREVDDNDGLASGGYCTPGDATPLELDAQDGALGFAPDDILAFASGKHVEPLRWSMQDGVALSPETGEGEITITVTPTGTARHVEPDTSSGGGENGGAEILIDPIGGCSAWLEIDVDVTVKSAGGALDESFEAVLRAQSPLLATLYYRFEDGVDGAFSATPTGSLAGFELQGLSITMSLSPYGAGGSFGGYFVMESGDGSSVGAAARGPFADFGASKCDDGGFTVGADDAIEGVTVADAKALFAEHDAVELTWQDGSTTAGTLAFSAEAEGGCVLLDNELTGDTTLVMSGTLAMTSEDGRLDGQWPGRLEAHVGEGGSFERVEFRLADGIQSNTMVGAAYYGFPNEDLSGYDAVGVSIALAVSGDALDGNVTLTGYTYADCATEQPAEPPPDAPDDQGSSGGSAGASSGGTPGCRGADPTVLAEATF